VKAQGNERVFMKMIAALFTGVAMVWCVKPIGGMVRGLLAASIVWGMGSGVAGAGGLAVQGVSPDLDEALPSLLQSLSADEQRYVQHVVTLSNPWMEGREPGDRGNELAAEYLEWWFRHLGLDPIFPVTEAAVDGTEVITPRAGYRQGFTFGTRLRVDESVVRVMTPAGPYGESKPGAALRAGVDYSVLGASGTGEAEGPVAFVGYAIASGPEGYATFRESDSLEGKIALMFRFEPLNDQGRSRWRERGFTSASGLATKLRAVMARKPLAVIVVNPPGVDDPRADRLESVRSGQGGGARTGSPGGPDGGVPVIQLSVAAADRLVRTSGRTLAELRRLADEKTPEQPGVIDLATTRVSIRTRLSRNPVWTENVAALLPGRGSLADQYVVIGGHYDHIGYGYFGSRGQNPQGVIHAGADDNASGTAGVLLAAEQLVRRYAALPAEAEARSIIFIGFTAEESGLNGARHFVRNAPVSASAITAMLNMDMIGRVRDQRLQIAGVGTARGFADLLRPVVEASGLNARLLPGGRGPSDHAVFYGESIPVLHFFSGLHDEYHAPGDVYTTINYTGAVRVVNLVSEVAMAIVQRPEPLEFTTASGPSADLTQPPRAPAPAPAPAPRGERPARPSVPAPAPAPALPGRVQEGGSPGSPGPSGDAAPSAGPSGVRVRFGIAPDNYADDQPGVLVGSVFPGTSAAEAGLQKGDRLMRWNSKPLLSVEDWMPLLASANPGDEVEITYVRDGQTRTVKVTLRAREREEPR
jgi:aminopeptidase YwaD